MKFEKVEPKPDNIGIDRKGDCPECGGSVVKGKVPCPDGDPQCMVQHYGYLCNDCGIILKPVINN